MTNAKRVLLADEDASVRGFLTAAFAREGCAVTQAASVEDAMRILESGAAFDLVLTDHTEQCVDGLGILRAMHKRLPGARGVLVSSGGYDSQTLDTARDVAHAVLVKPITTQDVWFLAALL